MKRETVEKPCICGKCWEKHIVERLRDGEKLVTCGYSRCGQVWHRIEVKENVA